MASAEDPLDRFPRERTWLLPALQAAQHRDRWLSPEALTAVAEHLRVPKSEVYGVATNYPEFRLIQPGRRVVRVCTGVSCRIRGSLDLLAACERRLGLKAGGTTADGAATLERLDCAFNCSMAPVVEAEAEQYGRVAERDLDTILGASGSAHGERLPHPDEREPASFADLTRSAHAQAPAGLTLVVGAGTCGLSVGAGNTLAALGAEMSRRGLEARLVAGGCNGLCWAAPVVTVLGPDGSRRVAIRVTPDRASALLDTVAANRLTDDPEAAACLSAQRRELIDRCGITDPGDIDDAVRRGSYSVLADVLAAGKPERVIETVMAAGLRGRGGAYFQAAVKWEGARRARGEPRYLIVNGEEGEPGIFKDRHLMEGDPHRLLEGALLAAYAAGASRLILYIHGEAHVSARRLERAAEEARECGFIGPRVLASDFSVEVEIRRGAGGFVLGEETALMESIEGRRAMPRPKPPFPTEAGLFGKPTVINNVETLFAVPLIVGRGAAWWSGLGGGHGSKVFGLSGHVARPGLVEAELGLTLRDLIDRIGGGVPGDRALKAVVVGGPSGILVHPRRLDEPLIPGGSLNPGTGGIVALDTSASVRDVVRTLLDFNTRESCGKCTPCREGTARLRDMLDGRGPASRQAAEDLSEVVKLASLCGLGQAAPLSILSALDEFAGELTL
jgi:NADH:ubiquinone oxidoreductase subunit F (NADH-binding)/NADH:ubiquinone oxidoreductase subunit E